MGRLQLTFAMIKPHAVKNPIVLSCIRREILECDFKVVECKRHAFSPKEAESFYGEHKGKFFYQRLVTSMTSGPTDLMVMARDDAIAKWREIMGPTKVFKAQYEAPHTLRGRFGLSDTRNATHGADSEQSVKREVSIAFPDFRIEKWYEECEPFFRKGEIEFDEANFVHKLRIARLLNDAPNKPET